MATNKQKISGYKNVYIVLSTKGGEGKTYLSLQILPLLFLDKNINIFEVDNNNNSKKMIENSKKISFKSLKIDDGVDAIDEIEFNNMLSQDDCINIIDAGVGDDTLKLLFILKEKELFGLTYVIPLSNSISNVDNAIQTIDSILSFDKELDNSQGYKPLLEYYTDLSPDVINEEQYNTNFVLSDILYKNLHFSCKYSRQYCN